MKTVISSKTGKVLEFAKQILYSLQVLTVGLFIPFLFVFGISYNTPKPTKPTDDMHISKPQQVSADRITVDFNKVLSDQNR
jgi:hypothetical protein